ncbi:MAG: hypothetical protein ABEN55_05335 [Bradymonadaceae bacterium]
MYRRHALFALMVAAAVLSASVAVAQENGDGSNAEDASPSAGAAAEGDPILVDYRGKLQNSSGKPISGIFHLEFNVYDSEKASKAAWSERQYVAVADGSYKVPLGRNADLTHETIEGSPWVGIELVGEGEILRDRLQITQSQVAAKQPAGDSGTAPPDNSKTKKLVKKARNTDKMAFADVAERAVTADKAKRAVTADKIGSMSAQEIEHLSNLAMERLGEHIADPNAHEASGGKIGDKRRVLNSIGGPGGSSYETMCPPGYVVTGITGGAGRVVDSLALICQPLK